MKPSTSKLKPTTLMAVDETLRSVYARNAPDVPDWFIVKDNEPSCVLNGIEYYNHIEETEELFFKWRWYYADKMIENFSK